MGAAVASIGKAALRVGEAKQSVDAVRRKTPKVHVRKPADNNQQLTITCMTVVIGLGILDSWVTKNKPLPERKFWIRIAMLGFILSLMTELAPKLGRNFSYLILVATLFQRSYSILESLYNLEPERRENNAPGAPGVDPISMTTTGDSFQFLSGFPASQAPSTPSPPTRQRTTPTTRQPARRPIQPRVPNKTDPNIVAS